VCVCGGGGERESKREGMVYIMTYGSACMSGNK
jgi:hypothetical protein